MKSLVILLLRIALGVAFISAVADRLGYWGPPGSALVAWGNMDHFFQYTSTLTFGASGFFLKLVGWTATVLEGLLGVFLIIGFKVKEAAFVTGFLLLLFGISMAANTHLKYALDYSVFSACFGAFLLAFQPITKWSLDHFMMK